MTTGVIPSWKMQNAEFERLKDLVHNLNAIAESVTRFGGLFCFTNHFDLTDGRFYEWQFDGGHPLNQNMTIVRDNS